MSRRKIESPLMPSNDEFRQIDANCGQSSERKSVFERLGTMGRRVVARNDYEETDLRYKVRRKQKPNDISPNRSVSPQIRPSIAKTSNQLKSDDKLDTNKVKSLVMAANRRSESPTTHCQSVTSSSNTSSAKRSTHSAHKWDDDIDDEELEQKRLQLQKELRELEKSGSHEDKSEANPLTQTLNVSLLRSRSSSILSSESGSYSSSLKSFTKTESSESSINDKKVVITSSKEDSLNTTGNKSKTSDKKTHVSSSITLKSSSHSEESNSKKSSEVKFDRHGNVRISLDEQERQKRLRAERFAQKPIDSHKKSTHESNEPKIVVTRDDSYSPPEKRSRDSTSERHRDICDTLSVDRNDDNRRDYKSKSSSSRTGSKYDSSPRRDNRKSKHEDIRTKDFDRSSRSCLVKKSPDFRDRSRDSRYSDRDNTSISSKPERRKGDNYSRDHSPTHSSHSKISRDRESSIGSDFSRKSKSERLSTLSTDITVPNITNELKSSEIKVNDPIIEEMSPISADSTIPDVMEIDSPNIDSKITQQDEKSIQLNKVNDKSDEQSEDNFSDWSEGEDELLLKNDDFETVDEVCNTSDNFIEKDSWNEKSNPKSKADSSVSLESHNKDDALEAISDDELDAIIGESDPIDSTVDSKGLNSSLQVLDSLEIDWKSLVTEPKAKLEFIPGSARKRFTPANVLMRIGFSQAFAGPLMTQKLIDFCQSELKEEFVPFRHPMAAVHSLINERIKERRYLFGVDTTQTTVLSGRKDLQIRKMLNKCNFKMFDNNSTTMTTASNATTSANELSVTSTNIAENNVSNIECF